MYLIIILEFIDDLKKLLGIGEKIVECLVLYLINWDSEDLKYFGIYFIELKINIFFCDICGFLIDDYICLICKDEIKDKI